MKLVLLITFSLIGCAYQFDLEKLVKEFEEIIDRDAKDCYAEYNLTREMVDQNIKNPKLFEIEQYRCFYHCIVLHYDIYDDKGNIVEEKFKKYLKGEADLRHKIYLTCKDVQEPQVCGKVAGLAKCIDDVIKKEAGL